MTTHQHLLNREVDNQDRLEKDKANLMKFVEDKNNDIMGYNNQLANLQVNIDLAISLRHIVTSLTVVFNSFLSDEPREGSERGSEMGECLDSH